MKSLPQPVLPAVLVSAAACCVVEALIVLTARSCFGNWPDAVAFSTIVLGPVSLWVGPLLYRRLRRASSS